MPRIVLPAKYYLSHFYELIDFLEEHYPPVFEPSHAEFLRDFRSLSEDAQCAFVRMVNRKGRLFKSAEFAKYSEIAGIDGALEELKRAGFAHSVTSAHKT
jgi:DNA polymerase-3 subunit epsilon